MNLDVLKNLLEEINGCTFATIDIATCPSPGIRKVTTGKRVILFTNKKSSGYDNLVRRRLIEAGKNPDNFATGELQWGQRVPNSPLIVHGDRYYIECVELTEGSSRFFLLDGKEVNENDLNLRSRRTNQGLSPEDEVHVIMPKIENITRIALMKEILVSEAPKRAILRVSPQD